MVIGGAAMRKLPHICCGVLKKGPPFAPSLHPAIASYFRFFPAVTCSPDPSPRTHAPSHRAFVGMSDRPAAAEPLSSDEVSKIRLPWSRLDHTR